MRLSEWFGLNNEEEQPEEETQEETPAEPQPQYATVEQMQQMIEGVGARLQENLLGLTQQRQQPEQTQGNFEWIREPTLDEINEAFEEGETKKAVQLQAQREAAREQRYNVQLAMLRQEGTQAISNVNSKLVDTSVPDYKKYEKDVKNLMDELGLPAESRNNLRLVELVTNAVKGGKIDEILAERLEAQKRQENLESTSEPSGNRQNPSNAERRATFSEESMMALRANGLDTESFAKKRGYGAWGDYEKQKMAYDAAKRGEGNYVPKWRRNK